MTTTTFRQASETRFIGTHEKAGDPYLMAGAPLPPREYFTANKDVEAAYDEFTAANAAAAHHNAEEARLRAEATAAEPAYYRAVAAAVKAGQDANTVVNQANQLERDADKQVELRVKATRAATEAGTRLAHLIREHRTTLLVAPEKAVEKSRAAIAKAVDALRAAQADHDEAFAIRLYMSRLALLGGSTGAYRPGVTRPEVRDALDVLTGFAGSLDTLKKDEANLQSWRDQERLANEANEREAAQRRVH